MGLVCLDVSQHRGGGGISRRANLGLVAGTVGLQQRDFALEAAPVGGQQVAVGHLWWQGSRGVKRGQEG